MRFALIAGELSGDILGAALIRALRARFPGASFYGVAGPRMVEAGCEAIESIEALSIMGLAEVLPALPRLFRLRDQLVGRFTHDRPDCVIGIDAPDFNLRLERPLRERGLKTVHLVSPTVWAWRQGRVKGIARAVDLMLCLFPFEAKFYNDYSVRAPSRGTREAMKAVYIGHPLADELDGATPQAQARAGLGFDPARRCVAVLPGSRVGELKYLAEPFARAVALLHARDPSLHFVTPIAKPKLRAMMQAAIAAHAPQAPWTLLEGKSREAMQAADAVLLASGTAALEACLLHRPLVVAYRTSAFTAWMMLKLGLLKTRHVSLPNLLAAEPTVTELLQDAATPGRLAEEVARLLDDAGARERQLAQFRAIHAELKRDSATLAADAIARLLQVGKDS